MLKIKYKVNGKIYENESEYLSIIKIDYNKNLVQ